MQSGDVVPPISRSLLQPGEWLVAAFPQARLVGPSHETAGLGTAAVTNRRVIFAPESGRLAEWSLEGVLQELDDSSSDQLQLTEGTTLTLPGADAVQDFAAALRAAVNAHQPY